MRQARCRSSVGWVWGARGRRRERDALVIHTSHVVKEEVFLIVVKTEQKQGDLQLASRGGATLRACHTLGGGV